MELSDGGVDCDGGDMKFVPNGEDDCFGGPVCAGVVADGVQVDMLDGNRSSCGIVLSFVDCPGGASSQNATAIETVLSDGLLV